MKTVGLGNLTFAGNGDSVLIDGERWTLDGAHENRERAEAVGRRWARGGHWEYRVEENRAGTGEWRHCPFALLLKATGKGGRP